MTLEEYKNRLDDEDFHPGWDCIEEAFKTIYKDKKAKHYATNLKRRANLGGDQYLDGYNVYESDNGYFHIVSFGMSELYGNVESFKGEWSGWGYEMTFKLKSNDIQDCKWVFDMFANLAFFTNTQENYLEEFQFILVDEKALDGESDSKITGLIVTHDTEVMGIDSIHGRVNFLQLVGVTQSELIYIMQTQDETESKNRVKELLDIMKADNPLLITDMTRNKSYI